MSKRKSTVGNEEKLRIEYVPLDSLVAWDRNPKKHDAGAIWQSIVQHGFKDPPKFEPSLNGGNGGIVEGNGRSHVLREMMLANEPAPRGILSNHTGWLVPVLFGVDAESERAAEAYGVDHNNLVLAGGDFTGYDMAKLWNEDSYSELLADLAQHEALPSSVDGEDVDDLINRLANDDGDNGTREPKEPSMGSVNTTFGVFIPCEGEGDQQEMFERLRDEGYDCVLMGTKPPGVKR